MLRAGVDIGSLTAKAVVLEGDGSDGDRVVSKAVVFTGYDSAGAGWKALAEALEPLGVSRDGLARVVSTGYGRRKLEGADASFTEILCHGRGARFLNPETRTVIDIGGQDSKVIALGPEGKVSNFAMNEKCAAGTGRFLEVMARALEVDLKDFGPLGLAAGDRARISSTCTVFAESEVVSHVAAGRAREEIVAGIHDAIAGRVAALARRVGVREVVMMTGGVALNVGVV
ncbi:MAG: acyl-CoA dehydratase activase, partial [Actinomycetota bacterium]